MLGERDFPVGHPASFDYDPSSAEAKEWARRNVNPRGERDFPVAHPKAADTPGNLNHLEVRAGVDPLNPHMQDFTGRSPEQAEAARAEALRQAEFAKESPALEPMDADVANAALARRRKELGVETLSMDETQAVLAELQHQREDQQRAHG